MSGSNNVQLGALIQGDAERDAVHVAIAPVIAEHRLKPGEHIGVTKTNHEGVWVANKKTFPSIKPIGIVDPFIQHPIEATEKFYIVLYPNTVSGMRHHWFHPTFPAASVPVDDPKVAASKEWIKQWAASYSISYDEVMHVAGTWLDDRRSWGEYINHGPALEGEYVPDEFWEHYEIVTGNKVAQDKRVSFFTCSC